jgi:putative lipoprotein
MLLLWARVGAAFAFAALAAPVPALAAMVTLSGEVTYNERIALPEGATLRVRLVDLTVPGSPIRVQAEAPISSPGQVPLTFTLNFDERAIDTAHRYAIMAEIASGLELWFRNATPAGIAPLGTTEPVMVVVNFVGQLVDPTDITATVPSQSGSILETTWRAEAIRGTATNARVDSTLSIASDMRAGGRGGCNSYFAQAELGADAIAFSAVAATRMACASETATTQEQAFFDALAAARHWQLDGEQLRLLDADGTELLRFTRSPR